MEPINLGRASSPRFSIVTPSFQASAWLKLCIASVADQRNITFEHIVQDSCSNDGTEAWLTRDVRVKASIEKDTGMYDGINRGLAKAVGDTCAYLNADEQYLPNALSQVARYFAANPQTDVLFGDAILVDEKGVPLSYRRAIVPSITHLRLADLNTLTCATFFRRRLLDQGYYFPTHLRVAGDQYWIFQLLKARKRMDVIERPLAIFTFTGSNLSQKQHGEKFGWLPKDERPRRWLTPLVVAWHRFRKFFAGAYRQRTVKISIYTQESPGKRCEISAHVGFRWPQ